MILVVMTMSSSLLNSPEYIEERVRSEFPDAPVMLEIARCESGFRQFDDTGVLRGVINSDDVGVLQINEYYHLEDSRKLGLDIHTLEGNLAYGRHLYDRQGTRPWNWSAHCWNAAG